MCTRSRTSKTRSQNRTTRINKVGKAGSHHTPKSDLLLDAVSIREGASDWGPEKGDDGINGAQQADLVLCSA